MTDETAKPSGNSLNDVMHNIPSRVLQRLTTAFDTGPALTADFLPDGLMNRNWRLRTANGTYALKKVVDVPVPRALRSLTVAAALADAGLPVCRPRVTTGGRLMAEIDSDSYSLSPWAPGTHHRGTDLTNAQARTLGALLARIHHALDTRIGLPAAEEPPPAKVTAPQAAAAEANRFLDIIAELAAPSPFDLAARRTLLQRKDLLRQHADDRPAHGQPAGPSGWTHGDFQPLNILWKDGTITAVLDWDRLAVRPYAEEVIRSAQVQFTTGTGRWDLARASAFIDGYQSVNPLPSLALQDAVDRLWWKRMTDLWPLQWHYDKGDHGPDRLWINGERLLHWWTKHKHQVKNALIR